MSNVKPENRKIARKANSAQMRHRLRIVAAAVMVVIIAVLALGAIFYRNSGIPSSSGGQAGKYAFQVGDPGSGKQAPPVKLPSTKGGTFDLASMRGKTVLLYFQEGITCQACWDQLRDIEEQREKFDQLGIDKIATITSDPLGALKQKVANEDISTPVLADPDLGVSKAYNANKYGMMGRSRDGHTFIIVGPDGKIEWRADYGGSPDYTMYVPVQDLLADMRKGLEKGSS